MLRAIWFYSILVICTGLTAIPLVLWYIFGWLGMLSEQKRWAHYVSYNWGRGLVAASGMRLQIDGLENVPKDEPVLFVSNHQSNFDIFVLMGRINKPKGFVSKIELAKIPVLSNWMKIVGCVFIDRSDIRQSLRVINEAAEIIKAGQSMVIFPEGTRSKGEEVAEFKKGSLRLAEKTGVPIVPVAISGTYKIMEANNGLIRPADVNVVIAPPIYFQELSAADKGRIHELVRGIIINNVQK